MVFIPLADLLTIFVRTLIFQLSVLMVTLIRTVSLPVLEKTLGFQPSVLVIIIPATVRLSILHKAFAR